MIRFRRVLVCAAVLAVLGLAVASLGAQTTPPGRDQVRLQFEITKGGALVAKPLLRIPMGESGGIVMDSVSFTVVPTRVDGGVSLQFEFKDGPKPRIVLKGDDGSGELKMDKDQLDVKVALVK